LPDREDGRARVTAPSSSPPWWAHFVPAISLVLAFGSIVMGGGGYIAKLQDCTRRIEQLENDARTDAKARTEVLQALDLRMARIEVKLEMMVPAKAGKTS
jgi:hypothetical protein